MDQVEHIPHSELLRFITCGSVDDGKSTLIGRLLHDTKAVFEDQLAAIRLTSQRRGKEGTDLALLTDGLQAEREQGITIDVAYRYFSTPRRRFVIADTPGHEQYTRNMVTGASTADLAIILVDVRKGVLTQTRRHTHLVRLLGIRRIVVAINKMDAVDYSEAKFRNVFEDFLTFVSDLGFSDVLAIPMSALAGDMVVERGDRMPWYEGSTLLEVLESVPVDELAVHADFRFPVQLVQRSVADGVNESRHYLGRIESGTVGVGDQVFVLPAGVKSTISDILTYDGSVQDARAGQSVTLTLVDQVDVSRGDMIVTALRPPRVLKEVNALLCWFSGVPMEATRRYLVRHGTQTVPVRLGEVAYRLDVNTSRHETAPSQVVMNDIVRIRLRTRAPLCVDPYEDNRATGSFILIDEITNDTVAAGMILPSEAS